MAEIDPAVEDSDDFDMIEALVDNLTDGAGDADSPKKKPVEGAAEAPKAATEEAPAAEDETTEEDPDDAELEWKVGETPAKAKLRDLKEAYQVRELSRAEASRAADAHRQSTERAAMANTALSTMLERAKADAKVYEDIDFLVLATQVDTATLTAIRQDAQRALGNVDFLTKQLEGARQGEMQRAQVARQSAVQEAIKVLSDPDKGIKGWGKDLYGDILTSAEKVYGAPRDVVMQIVEPWAVKMMHDAMLYHKSQGDVAKAKAAAEAKIEKVVNRATKQNTGKTGQTPRSGSLSPKETALKTLRDRPGDSDAVTDAILASFG